MMYMTCVMMLRNNVGSSAMVVSVLFFFILLERMMGGTHLLQGHLPCVATDNKSGESFVSVGG